MSNTRISIPTKIIHKNFHTHEIIPTKNFHTHENKAYTYQQNFHTHWVLIISYPQKLSQNSSSNTTSYIQCKASQTINIVQISQYQTTQQFKKCQKKKKKNMTTQWFPTKWSNVQNSHKDKQQQNDNIPL